MRLSVQKFRGEYPIVSARLLPPDMATTCVNARLQGGDFDGFMDLGNAYTTPKSAPVNTIWQLTDDELNTFWMTFSQSEVQSGEPNIDLALGTIAGDTTSRFFITGNIDRYTKTGPVADSLPQQSNKFFATDPSQQGTNATDAYPYVTFDIGIDSPASVPAISANAVAGLTTNFEFAQPASVNNVSFATAGSGYVSGLVLTVNGGTLVVTGYPCRIQVNFVTSTGAIDTATIGAYTVLEGGFYADSATPTSPATTTSNGTGSGATVDVTAQTISFDGWTPVNTFGATDNHWELQTDSWRVIWAETQLQVCYSSTSFNLQGAASWVYQIDARANDNGSHVFPDLVFYLTGVYGGGVNNQGPAISASIEDGVFAIFSSIKNSGSQPTNGFIQGVQVAETTGLTIPGSQYLRYRFVMTAQTNSAVSGYAVVATVSTISGTLIGTVTGFIPYGGEQLGVGGKHRGTYSDGDNIDFQNILVAVTQPIENATTESVNYVETDVDSFNDESGPSDPSDTISVQLNTQATPNTFGPVIITLAPTSGSSDVQIRNLYRSVNLGGSAEIYEYVTGLTALNITGASGAYTVGETVTGSSTESTGVVLSWDSGVLVLSGVATAFSVGETITGGTSATTGVYGSSANSTTTITYSDGALDSNLGDPLETANWAPPPENLEGILAAPNEIMVGFIKGTNTLCLSVPGHPHAWPTAYQRTTDYPIVALAARNNDIVILTTGTPYTAFGDDPDPTTGGFSMNREGSAQGCVSKRSVATHRSYGVIYASTNGLVSYRGQSIIDLIRIQDEFGQLKPLFTQQQWQALVPSSIIGTIHDDFYYFWYDNGTKKGGYILDLSPDGFGLVELDFHVTAVFNDPTSGYLFAVPDFSVYNIGGAPVSTAQHIIYQWDFAGSSGKRQKSWARNYWLFDRPLSFNVCRVRSADYTDLSLTITNESGSTAWNGAVTSAAAFVIGNIPPGSKWQATLTGKSTAQTIELAEAVEDLLSLQ